MSGSEDLSREELQSLLEIAGELAGQIDRDLLVNTILDRACGMTHSPDGSVLLYDDERGGLFFAAARGVKGAELLDKWGEGSNQRVPLEGSKAGEAFRSGEIIGASDLAADTQHFKGVDEQMGETSRSAISVPLRIAGQSIGVLQILNKTTADGTPLPYDAHDGALLTHFAGLAAAAIGNARLLRKLTAHMGLYSRGGSKDLIERLDRPATRESLTLLFADMRGFTQLCQSQAEPARTQEIMNDLLTMLADQVLRRGGIVNKFLGDGVLALFRCEDGPKLAVRCAFDMLDRFDSLRRRWDLACNEDLSFLDLGVGIATGPVAFGAIGNATVRDFTAIGTAVNLASAFQNAARNGRRVLIDNTTWTAAQEIVEDYEGPSPFELGKQGQSVVIKYRHFHLKRLKPDRPVRVFVSHNHRDREFVERQIREPLAKFGIETWYSNADIIPGDRYVQAIEDGLLKCDWVLVVVSENSVTSDWVRAELGTAMADPRFRQRILPLKAGDTEPSRISHELGLMQTLDVLQSPDVGAALYRFLVRRESELRANVRSA